MTLEEIRTLLAWCSTVNIILLCCWIVMFMIAHDLVFRMHSRFFALDVQRFDQLHYGGMILFKSLIVFFNLVPYLVMRLAM